MNARRPLSRSLILTVALALGAGAAMLRSLPLGRPAASPLPAQTMSAGQAVLPDLTGGEWFNVDSKLDWERLRGRPVLVEFWATWCKPCLRSIPTLREFRSVYAHKGLVVIGITREAPDRVRAYLPRLKIDYAVCSGQSPDANQEIEAIPRAVLVDPKGQVAWSGHPEDGLREAVDELFRRLPDVAPFRYAPGRFTGAAVRRPAPAIGFGEGELALELDALIQRGADLEPADCERLFEFYWRNLPNEGWEGDAAVRRQANHALVDLGLAVEKASPSLRRAVSEEVLRRLRGPETDFANRNWLCFAPKYRCEPGDQRVIAALRSRLEQEHHPLVISAIEGSLAKLDPDWPVAPPSRIMLAHEANRADQTSLRAKLFGRGREFARYDTYCKKLYQMIAARDLGPAAIRQLGEDYLRHDRASDGDVLIRSQILYAVTYDDDLLQKARRSHELMRTNQETVWRILLKEDPEPSLRTSALAGLRNLGHEFLDADELLRFVRQRLSVETDRVARLNLEWWRLKLTDPTLLN